MPTSSRQSALLLKVIFGNFNGAEGGNVGIAPYALV